MPVKTRRHAPSMKQRHSTMGVDTKKRSHSISKKAKSRQKSQNNPKRKSRLKHARRGGYNLGPMGAFPDSLIVQAIYGKYLSTITKYGINKITEDVISQSFKKYVHNPLSKYIGGLIESEAPSDSHELRDALHKSISTSYSSHELVSGTKGYKLVLNTAGIEYAKPVNKMPSQWLKHPGTHKKKTGLYDPEAKKGWFNLILLNGRNRALKLVMDWKNTELKSLLKIPFKELKMLDVISQNYRFHFFIHSPTLLKVRYK